jgi:hypothetical protein
MFICVFYINVLMFICVFYINVLMFICVFYINVLMFICVFYINALLFILTFRGSHTYVAFNYVSIKILRGANSNMIFRKPNYDLFFSEW